jgi:hypothetical protein
MLMLEFGVGQGPQVSQSVLFPPAVVIIIDRCPHSTAADGD